VEIINSSAFKKNTFQGNEKNFAGARALGNSSTIEISFFVTESERAAAEDSITRVSSAVADYARDLYSGNPFQYKLLSDPEISVGPVKPNLLQYLASGFGAGVLLYCLYWFLFVFLRVPVKKYVSPAVEIPSVVFHPQENFPEEIPFAVQLEDQTEKIREEYIEPIASIVQEEIPEKPEKQEAFVPDNLPVAAIEEVSKPEIAKETPPPPASEYQEPTDEEVKDRLNKLMRGEL
jgi:hypothetical protein